ncbi:MAG: hypothetical protein ACK4GO_16805 [Gemmobacter sp.]
MAAEIQKHRISTCARLGHITRTLQSMGFTVASRSMILAARYRRVPATPVRLTNPLAKMENPMANSTTTPPTETLGARAAAALKDPGSHSATELERIVDDLQIAEAQAALVAADARQAALCLTLTADEVAEAHRSATAADFDRTRLAEARATLEALWHAKIDAERAAARQAIYDSTKTERDRVSERTKAEYPPLAAALVELLNDIVAVALKVDAANGQLPEGAAPLDRPEGHLRGFQDRGDSLFPCEEFGLARLTGIVLPDLADWNKAHWPPGWRAGFDAWQRPFVFQKVARLWREKQPPANNDSAAD